MLNIEKNKKTFIDLCHQWIKRDGIEELLDWLNGTDFFTAPASSRFHLMVEGGLCQHSLNVFNQLKNEYDFNNLTSEEASKLMESIAIVGLFHDLTKVNFYTISTRNVKNEYGEWTKVPYYAIDNKSMLVGHGHKSAFLVNKYIKLSEEEFMAITYHMGYSGCPIEEVSEIFNKSQLTTLLHVADTKATFIIENEKKEK